MKMTNTTQNNDKEVITEEAKQDSLSETSKYEKDPEAEEHLVSVSAAFNYGVKEGSVKAFIESLTPFVTFSEEVETVGTFSSECLGVHYADLVAYKGELFVAYSKTVDCYAGSLSAILYCV